MNSREQEVIERLERAIEAMWAMNGEAVRFDHSNMPLADRIEKCAEEIEASIA